MFDIKPFSLEEINTFITEKKITFGSNGINLNGTVYIPAGASSQKRVPAVVMCHGYGNEQAAFEISARELAAEGVATLTFDFRGHGESGGLLDGSVVDDVIDAWECLHDQPEVDRKRMGLIGHSMGAYSAILAAGKLKKARVLIALACPGEINNAVAMNPGHFAHPMLVLIARSIFKIVNYIHKLKVKVDWKKFLEFWPKMKPSESLAEMDSCSKLFVFCLKDLASPYQHFLPAYAMACEPKQVMIAQGHHNTAMETGYVREQWIKWAVNKLHGGVTK
ncbi:MAG: alpha/beta fold hydrolase [Dehalococcoidia bacterium]|nr:alpha/beta fold hydrolase [Dehalococcoidia bacterium]